MISVEGLAIASKLSVILKKRDGKAHKVTEVHCVHFC